MIFYNDKSNKSWKSKMFRKVFCKVEGVREDFSFNVLGLIMRGSVGEWFDLWWKVYVLYRVGVGEKFVRMLS